MVDSIRRQLSSAAVGHLVFFLLLGHPNLPRAPLIHISLEEDKMADSIRRQLSSAAVSHLVFFVHVGHPSLPRAPLIHISQVHGRPEFFIGGELLKVSVHYVWSPVPSVTRYLWGDEAQLKASPSCLEIVTAYLKEVTQHFSSFLPTKHFSCSLPTLTIFCIVFKVFKVLSAVFGDVLDSQQGLKTMYYIFYQVTNQLFLPENN